MSFLTTIYIVTVEKLDNMLQSRMWYWDRDEAQNNYDGIVDQYEDQRIVTLYSIDVQDSINERVDELMKNRHSSGNRSPLDELRSTRKAAAPPKAEYTPLMRSSNDAQALYTERTISPDYWGYNVTKNFRNTWTVRGTDGDRIGAVYMLNPDGLLPEYQYEWYKAGVNEPIKATFPSLQAAVEGLIERYHVQ